MSDRSERVFAVLAPLNALVLLLPLLLAGVGLARDAASLLSATNPVDVTALETPGQASLPAHARATVPAPSPPEAAVTDPLHAAPSLSTARETPPTPWPAQLGYGL
jgi:hypothetical protein